MRHTRLNIHGLQEWVLEEKKQWQRSIAISMPEALNTTTSESAHTAFTAWHPALSLRYVCQGLAMRTNQKPNPHHHRLKGSLGVRTNTNARWSARK